MMYSISWTRRATKALRKLERRDAERIQAAVTTLATDPRPHGAKPLKGQLAGHYRLRVTEHLRVLYSVDDTVHVIEVANVGQREGIY